MAVTWIPKAKSIEEQIREEQLRLWMVKRPETVEPKAPITEQPSFTPIQPRAWQPSTPTVEEPEPTIAPRVVQPPTPTVVEEVPQVEEPEDVAGQPFWLRALEVFSTPFRWVEDTIIKPGLAIAGTALDLVPEVKREPGEDFFDWKRRSWEALETPGININVPWSAEPLRIDIKGIIEFAPWLLIPGAGQVGIGARAARGIAGALGRFGTAGKALGFAVEYSPWGLVEKTAGLAMRAGIKALSKGTERASAAIGKKVFGEIIEEPISPAVKKLSTFFDEAVLPARKKFEKAIPAMRAKQAANIEKIAKQFREGKISASKYTELVEKATAVSGVKAQFAVKAGQFTKEEADELLGKIIGATEKGFVARDSTIALRDLLMTGALPEPHHLKAFAQVFGEDFAKSVEKFARLPASAKDKALDLLNMPRAVLASGDLSATFRQGLILGLTRPQDVPRAFWRQLKYFASEKLSIGMDDTLRSHKLYKEAIESGVEFTTWRKGARMLAKEEPFFSNLAEKIPFVRRSERGFTGYLNELRMSSFEAAHNAMVAQGASKAELKLMGNFINIASGRGTLPANLDRYAPILNTVLFSARYQMATLQLPRQLGRMLISDNPYMRKEAAKALVTFVGGGAAILGLFKLGGAKVEIDPRSGDFGKIVIGETRLDIWRGYLQWARFGAQMLTGERKSAYGNMNQAQRSEIASRFLQSKLSPAMGLMLDLLKGETYMGEDLITDTSDVVRSFRERMLPLAVQDVMDAMEMSGIAGLGTAIPATLGVGVLTYVSEFVRKKNKIAKEMGYDTWDEIDPKTQRELQNSNAELQAAFIEFDRQVMGTAWGDYRLAGKAIEGIFTKNVNQATNQYRESTDVNKGITFREKIGDAFTARRGGYDARQKMPQFEDIVKRQQITDTVEALVSLGPEQLAIRAYTEALYGEDMYDEFGDYRFDLADIRKDQLRTQLGAEMYDYVEQYRGVNYETLPEEFQELTRAKKAMKPYWDVYDWAVKTYGKVWADSNRGQAFISRMRKQMRLMNPEIAKYYEMFYKRE